MTRLLCLGDSITDCGRLFLNPPLGNGYVQKLPGQDAGKGIFVDGQKLRCGWLHRRPSSGKCRTELSAFSCRHYNNIDRH